MIKVFIDNNTWEIAKYEPALYTEVLADFDINDSLVIDSETKEIVRIQDSTQGKKRIEELKWKKELTEDEKLELAFLTWEKFE